MNYTQAVEWLYNRLPMFSRTGPAALKPGLGNILAFCEHLGNPHLSFRAVHIAGTNGKGSTAHMLSSVLQEAGYKVGLTTSPHLVSLTERVRINGKPIPEVYVAEFVTQNQTIIEELKASYFEVLIALAFRYFAHEEPDIAIVETGLGGRLDSTNILKPLLSIITNISFDHKDLLGATLPKIALEKAGIIKQETPVVIGERHPETEVVFKERAAELNAPIYFTDLISKVDFSTDLKGNYQKLNVRTVIQALEILQNLGFELTQEHITRGLSQVVKNTGLRGRWEILQQKPLVVADVAHNPEGLKLVVQQLESKPCNHLHMVMGFVCDKDIAEVFKFLPKQARYYLSSPKIPRALPLERLKKEFPKHLNGQFYDQLKDALYQALSAAREGDVVFIGGSTFVVAELLPTFD